MRLLKLQVIIGLLSVSTIANSQQGTLTGQIKLDTIIWSKVAYLSLIPDFDAMNSMSNEIIIDQASIDNSGRFSFRTSYLPEGDNLVRIHISRRSDPAASLIIGGREENHVFIIANRISVINLTGSSDTLFKNIKITGYHPNELFQDINRISEYFDTTNTAGYPVKTDLMRNAISEKLRHYADTCTNPLVALYAIYQSRFEKNYPVNQQYYTNFLSRWTNEKSSYFVEFRKKVPKVRNITYTKLIISILVFFFMGAIAHYAYSTITNRKKILIKNLSVQERKIFNLLTMGKSNKEISEILVIEVSTVKSHINSIYSKLNISSRKEILNMDLENGQS